MDYVIAIPSHKRAQILIDRTLSVLEKYNIPHEKIHVFVSAECWEEYDKKLPQDIKLIISEEGVANNRTFISNWFNQKQFILSLDDDIEKINRLMVEEGGNKTIEIESLHDLIIEVYNLLKENNLALAGVYPVNNHFFMKDKITTDLRFINGGMKFYFNDRFCERRNFELIEDFETSIKYYLKYNGVLRLWNVAIKANYLTLKGGMQDNADRSLEAKEIECERFKNRYFNYCDVVRKNDNKRCEIKFRKTIKRNEVNTLWIGDKLNPLSRISIKSWLDNGYIVNIWTYDPLDEALVQHPRVNLCDAQEIWRLQHGDWEKKDILPFSDLWRYKLLYIKGGIWLDADMLLIENLPEYEYIISSEHTMQSGAFKSKKPFVANIGVLRFPPQDEFLDNIIKKIYKKKKESKFVDNMRIFQREVRDNYGYSDHILGPETFCPIPWWQCKELYMQDFYNIKYGVETPSILQILRSPTTIGVHLWNNFSISKHKIDFENIHNKSSFSLLKELFSNNKQQ